MHPSSMLWSLSRPPCFFISNKVLNTLKMLLPSLFLRLQLISKQGPIAQVMRSQKSVLLLKREDELTDSSSCTFLGIPCLNLKSSSYEYLLCSFLSLQIFLNSLQVLSEAIKWALTLSSSFLKSLLSSVSFK